MEVCRRANKGKDFEVKEKILSNCLNARHRWHVIEGSTEENSQKGVKDYKKASLTNENSVHKFIFIFLCLITPAR